MIQTRLTTQAKLIQISRRLVCARRLGLHESVSRSSLPACMHGDDPSQIRVGFVRESRQKKDLKNLAPNLALTMTKMRWHRRSTSTEQVMVLQPCVA